MIDEISNGRSDINPSIASSRALQGDSAFRQCGMANSGRRKRPHAAATATRLKASFVSAAVPLREPDGRAGRGSLYRLCSVCRYFSSAKHDIRWTLQPSWQFDGGLVLSRRLKPRRGAGAGRRLARRGDPCCSEVPGPAQPHIARDRRRQAPPRRAHRAAAASSWPGDGWYAGRRKAAAPRRRDCARKSTTRMLAGLPNLPGPGRAGRRRRDREPAAAPRAGEPPRFNFATRSRAREAIGERLGRDDFRRAGKLLGLPRFVVLRGDLARLSAQLGRIHARPAYARGRLISGDIAAIRWCATKSVFGPGQLPKFG